MPRKQLPSPTPEFLAELIERAKRYGWTGDYVEIRDFLVAQYKEAGMPPPDDLEPYEDDPEEV